MKIVEINGVAPGDDQIQQDGDQNSDQNNTEMSFGEIEQNDLQEGQNGEDNVDEAEPFGDVRSPNRVRNEEHKSDDITVTADPRPQSRLVDDAIMEDNRPSAIENNFINDDYQSNQRTAKKEQIGDEIAEAMFKPNDDGCDLISENPPQSQISESQATMCRICFSDVGH